jgi:hypothetical protein
LHLQEEISIMEEHLAQIDATIAQHERASNGRRSRRPEDPVLQQLFWQRADLVSRTIATVDQYSKFKRNFIEEIQTYVFTDRSLASYSKIARSFDHANTVDVQLYKDWLAEHGAGAESESAYLEFQADLISVTTSRPIEVKRAAMTTGYVVLITIVAFKLVTDFFSRLVLGLVVTAVVSYSNPTVPVPTEGIWGNFAKPEAM